MTYSILARLKIVMEVNIKSTLNTMKADIDKTLQQIRAEVADGGVGG